MRILPFLMAAGVLALGAGYVTRPAPLPAAALDGLTPDSARGAMIFAAAGCAACHSVPDGPPDVLAGGRAFATPFGTFHAPNISPDPVAGIGAWTDLQIASAIQRGVGRGGEHLYPAFPYATYIRAETQDVVDLIAYLRSLPPSPVASLPHDLGFPFNIRAGLGVWKLLFLNKNWVLDDIADPTALRGRYLVEALGHCGECHTPRNLIGGLQTHRWLSGGPNPDGEGRIPNITPARLDWSEADIAEYLKSGFTPEFDTAGGSMAEVVTNTAQLSDDDRAAIAAYLKAVPPVAN